MCNQKVKILKTGLWAVNPPNPGECYVTKGEIRDDLPEHLIERMIDSGCLEFVDEKKTTDQGDMSPKEKQVRGVLEILRESAGKLKAKESLEKWGKENLGVDVDRRKRAKEIIEDLVTEYMRQAGDE